MPIILSKYYICCKQQYNGCTYLRFIELIKKMKAWKIVLNLIHGLLNVFPQLVRPQIHEEMNAFKNSSHKYSILHK